jgi:hypothetical protein
MEKNKKVLFVTEKWCDAGRPEKGLTNNYHNLFRTFESTFPDISYSIAHMDEYALLKQKNIDSFLPSLIDKISPDIIIFSLLGKSHLNPSEVSFRHAKDAGCKTVFIWPDVFDGWGRSEIMKLNEKNLADLHVCWASEQNLDNDYDNLLWTWTPEDETLYFPLENGEKADIDVSFVGSPRYAERQNYLNYLLGTDIKINIAGGQREESLAPFKYAELIRRSKINLNFPGGPDGYDQVKGRVFETLASRSLLMERKNSATSQYLTDGKHYITFENESDLEEKIRYYLKHEEEREQIANDGYSLFKERYTAEIFWKNVMKELGE